MVLSNSIASEKRAPTCQQPTLMRSARPHPEITNTCLLDDESELRTGVNGAYETTAKVRHRFVAMNA
jgi:hypothetical protein